MKPQPLTKEKIKLAGSYCIDEDEEIIPKKDIVSAVAWLEGELAKECQLGLRIQKKIYEAFIGVVEPKQEAKE